MNERFFELDPQKQLRIINAGLTVFAQNEYKRASTDDMARLGGISKGLLFYYFHNKKAFYLYLFDFAHSQLVQYVVDEQFDRFTDFFDLCEYAAQKKMELLDTTPHLFNFMLRAFSSDREEISPALHERFTSVLGELYGNYFRHIDRSRFKPGIQPEEVLQMLTYISDGYIHDAQRAGKPIIIKAYMEQYRRWAHLLRQMAYQEASIHD